MATVFSANITQAANGSPVYYNDTTTGITGLVSKVLTIYDSNGDLLDTINMGSSTTASYVITTDLYLATVLTIVDGNGTTVGDLNYLSTAFYEIAFANAIAALPCDFNCGSNALTYIDIADLYKQAAERYALSALAPAAQNAINAANYYITGNV
jgi:hypothetical protein